MLKRRLHLQIYFTIIVSLVTVVVLTGLLWNIFGRDRFNDEVFDIAGRLAVLSLPGAASPADEQRAAVQLLGRELQIDLTLFDRQNQLIGASGRASPLPSQPAKRGGWRGMRGGAAWAISLPDGRLLVADITSRKPRRPLLNLALLLGSVALGVGLASYPFVRRLTRRLERLQAGVQRMGAGDLAARVEIEGRDEVAALAASFNEAAGKIEKLVGAHRLLLANASHELRTPLSRIRLGIEMLQSKPDGARTDARTAALQQDIAELDDLIDEILLMSRLDARSNADMSQSVDLLAVIAEECTRYDNCGVSGTAPELQGDVRLLHRLVRNLLDNAVKHGAPPVKVHLASADGRVSLTVSDVGGGIPEGLHDKVFQPFYRPPGKQNVKGYGLGLPLVRQIAEAHGGTAEIAEGATIRVTLPVGRAE